MRRLERSNIFLGLLNGEIVATIIRILLGVNFEVVDKGWLAS